MEVKLKMYTRSAGILLNKVVQLTANAALIIVNN